LDQPVTRGVYRFSRNPQNVGLVLAFIGTAVAVGSWLMVLLGILLGIGAHSRILAEERACLMQYGTAYQTYMDTVPRYFGLPKQSPTKDEEGNGA
jgi:protein-S-isoprenylcysteine O-methyltransferase Ste14